MRILEGKSHKGRLIHFDLCQRIAGKPSGLSGMARHMGLEGFYILFSKHAVAFATKIGVSSLYFPFVHKNLLIHPNVAFIDAL